MFGGGQGYSKGGVVCVGEGRVPACPVSSWSLSVDPLWPGTQSGSVAA